MNDPNSSNTPDSKPNPSTPPQPKINLPKSQIQAKEDWPLPKDAEADFFSKTLPPNIDTNVTFLENLPPKKNETVIDPEQIQTIVDIPSIETNPTVIINPASPSEIHESKTILTNSQKNLVPPLPPRSNSLLGAAKVPPSVAKKIPIKPSGKPSVKPVSQHPSVLYELFAKKFLRRSLDLSEKQDTHSSPITPSKYTYIQEIAEGGMGRVDLVKDNDLNRHIARKYILPQYQKQQEILERFAEEAQTTGQLEHPNIIPIHDIGLDVDGNLFFTMKFIKGKTLEDVLREKKSATFPSEEFSRTRFLQIFQQIGHALSFAHSKGVIHRDLKPGNIMLGSFGEVIVMDWGLAKILGRKEQVPLETEVVETVRQSHGSKTMVGSVVGTPAYMPPEQALGEVNLLDERSDVYSLGAILYELLTLQPPFGTKGDVRSVLAQVVNEPILPPEKLVRDIPRELAAITLKALEKEKENRYPSVSAMLKDIQCFLEGKEVSAFPDSLWRKVRRKARRHATALKWMTGSFLILVISLTLLWNQYHRSMIQDYLKAGDTRFQEVDSWEVSWEVKWSKQTRNPYESLDHTNELINRYRKVLEDYRKILDFDFHHLDARKKLAEVSFKLWKIGLTQKNDPLRNSSQQEIQYYLGSLYSGSDFEKRIEGKQSFTFQTQPETEIYLFRYGQKDGYLNPTPYQNPKSPLPSVTKGAITDSLYDLPLKTENFWGKTDAKGRLLIPDLEAGSYLAVLEKSGFLTLRIPVWIQHPELQLKPLEPLGIEMVPKAQEIPGFTYVPRLRFLYGGTSSAGAGKAEWVTTEGGFFLKTQEVTLGEYAEFLEHLCEAGKFEDAEKRSPRSFKWKLLLVNKDEKTGEVQRTDKGKFMKYNEKLVPKPLFSCEWNEIFSQDLKQGKIPPPLKEMWIKKNQKLVEESIKINTLSETSWKLSEKNVFLGLEYEPKNSILQVFELQSWQEWKAWKNWKSLPVSGISYLDTQAYLSWISQRDQKTYRLPTEKEWELAARGVDGRKYSWGNGFEPEFTRITQGYGGMSGSDLENIDQSKRKDESPFGVCYLAGSLAEWVEGLFDPTPAGSANQETEREVLHVIRGNAWGLTPIGLECAFRTNGPQDYYHLTIGFRYCFTYQP